MALPRTKFPRHHAQRQALGHGKNTSTSYLWSQEQRQQHEPQTIRHRRADLDSDEDTSFKSESESNVDVDREEEDSGYGLNADDEAEYLNGLIEKFGEEGPQISNLSDVALKMIQVKQHKFQK